MAYLIYSDSRNLQKTIEYGIIRIPRTLKSRFDLHRIRKGDNLFLLDYEEDMLYGSFKSQSERVREEKNPRTGPFNGTGNTRNHYLYESIFVDCSGLYRRGIPAGKLKNRDFFLENEDELFLLEKLRFQNERIIPIIINLALQGRRAKATVVEVSGETDISHYKFDIKNNLFALIYRKKRAAEDLLRRGEERNFEATLKEIGKLVYCNILDNLNLERVFDEGGYSIYITGDENVAGVPFEISYMNSYIFEKNILTFRGEKEQKTGSSALIRRVLVLADPGERYEWAYREGVLLYNLFRKSGFSVDFISRPMTKDLLVEFFSIYDIIHFSGHSGIENSSTGWDIGDSVFTIQDLVIQRQLPLLIFSSSCGNTLNMGFDFLKLGVRNAVSSRWKVPDRDISGFLLSFYRQLIGGMEIGYSFNRALLNCYRNGDILPLIFVLQGENRVVYEHQNT